MSTEFLTPDRLRAFYRGYIDCLNRRDWDALGDFVHAEVRYGDTRIGLSGYRQMLERDVAAIPDLQFRIDRLVAEPPTLAARLLFDCTPKGELFGLPVNGRRVQFSENVFYTLREGRFAQVWSVIDKAAIAATISAQL